MKNYLKQLERLHNSLSDSSAVWFPFLFLKPKPQEKIGWGRLLLMTLCFANFCTILFVLRALIFRNEIIFCDVLKVALYFHLGFALWFACVTRVFWNRRASQLLSFTAVFLAAVISSISNAYSKSDIDCFQGIAKSLNGEPAYIEKHRVVSVDGKASESLTRYYSPDGKNKVAEMKSNYSKMLSLPEYQFQILQSSYFDEVKIISSQQILVRNQKQNSQISEKIMDLKNNHVAGQGFHQLIRQKLKNIFDGEVLHIRLVFPSRLDDYEFRIRSYKKTDGVISLRLEIDSWLLRMFAPYVEADYEIQSRRLLRYRGTSNIPDQTGKNQKVEIAYSYGPNLCPEW